MCLSYENESTLLPIECGLFFSLFALLASSSSPAGDLHAHTFLIIVFVTYIVLVVQFHFPFFYVSFSCRPTRLQLFGAERRVISVTGSKRVMYALLADGSVYSWGEGIPALGHGDNQPRYHYYGVVGRKHVIYTLVSLAVASIQALVHGDFNQGVCTCDGKLYVCVWCLILRATSV